MHRPTRPAPLAASTLPASILAALVIFTLPALASAQQPLAEFLAASETRALDLREARAALDQARSQSDEARARLLPSFVGTLGGQLNEPVVAPMVGTATIVISPREQADARAQLSVPILDLAAWVAFFQSEEVADAADERIGVAQQGVRIAVVQLWHQLVGARALVSAAEHNVATAEDARVSVAARVEVGLAAQLELARAETEVARGRQSLAAARLGATLAERNLENLTGLAPSGASATLQDDLHTEAPLPNFLARLAELPQVRAARRDLRVAEHGETGAWLALLPTVSGVASTRYTSASGFGPDVSYVLGVTATWQLDFGRPAAIGTRGAATSAARVRLERAEQQAETAVFEAWHRVEAAIASAEAAASAQRASERAAQDALARFQSGAGTQLDHIQAERDRFAAEVQHIQALADLAVARAVLRIRSGADE